jgi:hypothetical protein
VLFLCQLGLAVAATIVWTEPGPREHGGWATPAPLADGAPIAVASRRRLGPAHEDLRRLVADEPSLDLHGLLAPLHRVRRPHGGRPSWPTPRAGAASGSG